MRADKALLVKELQPYIGCWDWSHDETGTWGFSTEDGDGRAHFLTKEDALQHAAVACDSGDSVFVFRYVCPVVPLPYAMSVLSLALEDARTRYGFLAGGWLEQVEEAAADEFQHVLDKAFVAWLRRRGYPLTWVDCADIEHVVVGVPAE